MKKLSFFLLFFIVAIQNNIAQNLLSPIWKYAKTEEFPEIKTINPGNWQEINLLLSWERQGHCWMDKNYILYNQFFVDKNDKNLQIEFSLQGDISAVYINQKQVIGEIDNSFWSERDKRTKFEIPDSLVKRNKQNNITVFISNLSYTGGLSHNYCSIHSADTTYKNNLTIKFPKPDHVFLAGDKKQFIIESENITESEIKIIVNDDFHRSLLNETIIIKKGKQEYSFDFSSYKPKPGFYECVVISKSKTYCGTVGWFAVQPEDIKCPAHEVPGFDTYWQNALDELQKVEPDYKIRKVDSLCSPNRDGYIVEMKSQGNLTIRAYYFVPKTKGKHPVVLHVPGYSYGFEYLDNFIKRKGNFAEMALCVRGHGISKDEFNPWNEMTLWAVNICDKDKYVYRSIYMDCVRAVDFLYQQPEIDNTRIGVAGGSQGGGLSLATAGLCKSRIAACAIFDPFLCDIREHAQIRTIIYKELESFISYPANKCDINKVFSVLDLVDTKYFVPNIKCPVYFSTSLFDDDCPPHCGFSAYNNLKTPKKFEIYPNDSHLGESGQYDKLFYEIEKMLNGKTK